MEDVPGFRTEPNTISPSSISLQWKPEVGIVRDRESIK